MPPPVEPSSGAVLLIDDEPSLLNVFSRWLRVDGLQVECASNGLEALELLRTKTFDVVVSDIAMPGMTGVELLRTVRQQDADLPVILMTGRPEVETAIEAMEYGALRYLVKPFDGEALGRVVQQAVQLNKLTKLKREALGLLGERERLLSDRAALEQGFTQALGALWMAYQPIVSAPRGELFAFEALVRSDSLSLPNPAALLEAADRLGRQHELGAAIRALIADQMDGAPAQVFVNLHPRDLLDPALYDPRAPLSRHARHVVLEITERAALEHVTGVADKISSLRKLGYRIAIDDLGAGYAGLTSFTQLEPEVVKFDMSMVRDLHLSPKRKQLIQSMTAVFREMSLSVVAEGVETAEERDALLECGLELLQGYFFARPARGFTRLG